MFFGVANRWSVPWHVAAGPHGFAKVSARMWRRAVGVLIRTPVAVVGRIRCVLVHRVLQTGGLRSPFRITVGSARMGLHAPRRPPCAAAERHVPGRSPRDRRAQCQRQQRDPAHRGRASCPWPSRYVCDGCAAAVRATVTTEMAGCGCCGCCLRPLGCCFLSSGRRDYRRDLGAQRPLRQGPGPGPGR